MLMIKKFKLIAFVLISLILISCSSDEETTNNDSGAIIWKGETITFTKANGADPSNASNQDRLTSNVWITRGNGGQIFNIAKESSATKGSSPAGTRWAVGNINEINNLSFQNFRAALNDSPPSAVGKNMVMHLVDDNIYLSVKFTSWSSGGGGQNGGGGGFAYERSTP